MKSRERCENDKPWNEFSASAFTKVCSPVEGVALQAKAQRALVKLKRTQR